jgi:hypothetical protein
MNDIQSSSGLRPSRNTWKAVDDAMNRMHTAGYLTKTVRQLPAGTGPSVRDTTRRPDTFVGRKSTECRRRTNARTPTVSARGSTALTAAVPLGGDSGPCAASVALVAGTLL